MLETPGVDLQEMATNRTPVEGVLSEMAEVVKKGTPVQGVLREELAEAAQRRIAQETMAEAEKVADKIGLVGQSRIDFVTSVKSAVDGAPAAPHGEVGYGIGALEKQGPIFGQPAEAAAVAPSPSPANEVPGVTLPEKFEN